MDDDRYEVGGKVGRPPNPEESLMIQIGTIPIYNRKEYTSPEQFIYLGMIESLQWVYRDGKQSKKGSGPPSRCGLACIDLILMPNSRHFSIFRPLQPH